MAKFLFKQHGEVDVFVDEVQGYNNDAYQGIKLLWSSPALGWGEYSIYQKKEFDEEYQEFVGQEKIYADSEYMDKNNDKKFLRALMEDLIEKVDIIS